MCPVAKWIVEFSAIILNKKTDRNVAMAEMHNKHCIINANNKTLIGFTSKIIILKDNASNSNILQFNQIEIKLQIQQITNIINCLARYCYSF